MTSDPPSASPRRPVEEDLRAFIESRGYRRCDTAACNCGSFHGGHAEARLSEIRDDLEAVIDLNGLTIRGGVRALLTESQRLREQVVEFERMAKESSEKHRSIAEKAGLLRDTLVTLTDDDSFAEPIVELASNALAQYDALVYGDSEFHRNERLTLREQVVQQAQEIERLQNLVALGNTGQADSQRPPMPRRENEL